MHHSMAREIIRHRESDLRKQARRDGLAKEARQAAKAQRAAAAVAAAAVPRIPDYVDGTFAEAANRTHAGA
jgi:hypothetical protein